MSKILVDQNEGSYKTITESGVCVCGGGGMGMGVFVCLFVCVFPLYVLDSLFKNIDFNTILAYFWGKVYRWPGRG